MRKEVLLVFVLVFIAGLASASFDTDEDSSRIEIDHFGGDFVRGFVNMSFDDQKNANFSSNFEGGVSLLGLFDKLNFVEGKDYFCEPRSCVNVFRTLSGTGLRSQTIAVSGAKQLYGFKLNGDEVKIDSFKFDLRGVQSVSGCQNQLAIDLLDDGEIDFYNKEYATNDCGVKEQGCFSSGESLEDAVITNTPLCQKIRLGPGPAYKIGAVVNRLNPEAEDLEITLYDIDNAKGRKCDANPGVSNQYTEAECIVNYSSIDVFDAFVCVS